MKSTLLSISESHQIEEVAEDFRKGNRLDVDAILASINTTIAEKVAQLDVYVEQYSEGVSAALVSETDTRRFTSDAEIGSITGSVTALLGHAADTGNPHSVTAAQVGTMTTAAINSAIAGHANRGDNPHGVTAAQVGAMPADVVAQALSQRLVKENNLSDVNAVAGRANLNATGNLWRVTTMTSSGNHELGGQTTAIMVIAVGGGGGSGATEGGGSAPRCAAGGGGGEVAMMFKAAGVNPGGLCNVVIGAGGSGGTPGGFIAGTSGGATTFTHNGQAVVARGGEGGDGDGLGTDRRDGGPGGSGGSGGFFRTAGERGGHGVPGEVVPGFGGASGLGYGARRSSAVPTFSGGIAGHLYGGGASGAIHLTNGMPLLGAAGGQGICIIMEYR